MNKEEILNYETLHNKIYKETEEYGRTQFVSRIVDLQQKIELLNQCIKTDKDKIDYWVDKYEELQQRLEKAIEYIESGIYYPNDEDDMLFEKIFSLTDDKLDELLEILKGEEK